jgi:hypothetical protein
MEFSLEKNVDRMIEVLRKQVLAVKQSTIYRPPIAWTVAAR